MDFIIKHQVNKLSHIPKSTLVFSPLSKADLEYMLIFQQPLKVLLGVSICHEVDQFCKATGRELAKNNANLVDLKLNIVYFDEGRALFCLTGEIVHTNHKPYYIDIKLTTVADSEHVRFDTAHVFGM